VLSAGERNEFLSGEVIVEEKVDGANIGISSIRGDLAVQNRGEYITRPAHPQFSALWPWLDVHRQMLRELLGHKLVLFGEWCFAVHTLRYDALPDWFLGFDIYERGPDKFWSAERRNALLIRGGISAVGEISRGRYTLRQLADLASSTWSRYSRASVEGIYLRRDSGPWLKSRAKIVRTEFAQSIDEHWSARAIQHNHLRRAG
jgi:ATP-dependent RNA circularization protein (DNA/RNA ligase family)